MKKFNFQEVLYFLVGFAFGLILFTVIFQSYLVVIRTQKSLVNVKHQSQIKVPRKQLYDEELADTLFNEVKILCWIFTHPNNHRTKVPHVRNTWGKKCNKLLFISVKPDPKIPELVVIPVENGREHLWNKTKLTMEYVYKNHLNDADYFMRADDDKYASENINGS